MKRLLIGGPYHGRTFDIRGNQYDIVLPLPVSRPARFIADTFDVPSGFLSPGYVRYRRQRFAWQGRNVRDIYVCDSDMSTRTAESYMFDVLARAFDEYVERTDDFGR